MYRSAFINLYLNNGFDVEEAKTEVDFAIDTLFNYKYTDYLVGKRLDNSQLEKLEKVFKERVETHRPLQQIVGQSYFYKRKFFVDENTLIPRPETELLVYSALEIAQKIENPFVLDIGTGTGCIPVTLVLENSNITADAVDISEKALETAKKNAVFHNVSEKVNFIKSDLFENVKKQYNMIVSNPPYIPVKDKETLQIEVRDFDPAIALFTKDELGIEFYEKIIKQAMDYLLPDGYILFELGINQAEPVGNMLVDNKYKPVEIIQDYNSIPRVIIAQK